jgi:hypothetical protein
VIHATQLVQSALQIWIQPVQLALIHFIFTGPPVRVHAPTDTTQTQLIILAKNAISHAKPVMESETLDVLLAQPQHFWSEHSVLQFVHCLYGDSERLVFAFQAALLVKQVI